MIKKIIAAAVAGVVFIGASTVISAPTQQPPSRQEIFAQFLAVRAVDSIVNTNVFPFDELPVLTYPHSAGVLSHQFVQQGLAEANFVRFLAGLPGDLVLDTSMNRHGQHGAVLLASEVQLTHSPPRPENMNERFFEQAFRGTSTGNLSWGANSLWEAIRAYMHNSDRNGISHLGHRRWILNPQLQRVGFGFANRFASMHVLDTSRRGTFAFDTIAWPAAGNFPVEYMAGSQAWSLSLNPLIYDNTRISNIEVSLTRRTDGRTWQFSANDNDTDGQFFNVSTHGFGVPFCIIFRPDGIYNYNPRDSFLVEVTGVYRIDGQRTTITYEVDFFRLFGKIVMRLADDNATEIVGSRNQTFNLGAAPVIDEESGRTLVPLQSVVERMGGAVSFNEATQAIAVIFQDRTVQMWVGQFGVLVNGEALGIDVAPQVIDGAIMVPVRAVEHLGAHVHWNGTAQSITVVYLPY